MRWWWCPLCTRPTRLVGFLVLAHWNKSPRINMRPTWTHYPDSVRQTVFVLSPKYQFYCLWLTRAGLWFTIYRTRGEDANHCITDAVYVYKLVSMTWSISNLFDHDLIKSWNIFDSKLKIEIVSLQTENRIVLPPVVVINRNIMLSNIFLVNTITEWLLKLLYFWHLLKGFIL